MSQSLVSKFDKNCKEFILFDGAIQTKFTRISYHHSLDEFMKYAKFEEYSQIKDMPTQTKEDRIAEIDKMFNVKPSDSIHPS